jgi:hypothetical protein
MPSENSRAPGMATTCSALTGGCALGSAVPDVVQANYSDGQNYLFRTMPQRSKTFAVSTTMLVGRALVLVADLVLKPNRVAAFFLPSNIDKLTLKDSAVATSATRDRSPLNSCAKKSGSS